MPTYKVMDMIDGLPTFQEPLNSILAHCQKGGAIKVLSPLEHHTDQQRAWFKGVLLPSLAKETGDSVRHWETRIIMELFPHDVTYVAVNNQVCPIVPSISQYGKNKMKTLIEESVDKCHDWGFSWVTLPDRELRK